MDRLEVVNKQFVRVILVPGAEAEAVRKILKSNRFLFSTCSHVKEFVSILTYLFPRLSLKWFR